MENMNVQQASEWGKSLDFPQVWTAIMGLGDKINLLGERQEKTDEQLRQNWAKTDEEFAKTRELVQELTKNIGGVGNTFGDFMEGMFTAKICSKFDAFEHTFTKVANSLILYKDDGKILCEIDAFLENGEYVMAIEVKTKCEMKDINDHLKRLEKIRAYMDGHNDNRKILGCIASSLISNKLIASAEENGLYVMVQTGEAVEILEKPGKFTEGVW
jgi:hypothetical protein